MVGGGGGWVGKGRFEWRVGVGGGGGVTKPIFSIP